MKVIYIAGKYRSGDGEYYVRQNIRKAEEAALFVWLHGGVALCPHKNTAGFGGAYNLPDEVWLNGDLRLLQLCDAVWLIEGWETSSGAKLEHEVARKQNIPCLFSHIEVEEFIQES
jgi:hypothetical protein